MTTINLHGVKCLFVHSVKENESDDKDIGIYYTQKLVVVTDEGTVDLNLFGDIPIEQRGIETEKLPQFSVETGADGVVWRGDNKEEALKVLESEGGVIVDHFA